MTKRNLQNSCRPAAAEKIADRVRTILHTRNLTLYKVSRLTRANYPKQRSYHLPPNLYFHLRSARWSPRIEQLWALSRLSGYRLTDWLAVFGFRLDDISRLETRLAHPRTVLLDSNVYDLEGTIAWFKDRGATETVAPVAPLIQLIELVGEVPIATLTTNAAGRYLYAKIGERDAYAFPALAPGSIVRVDSRSTGRLARRFDRDIANHIFLVRHSRGLCCCRLHFGSKNRITLTAGELPFAHVELRQASEARILGVVDMELRPLTIQKRLAVPRCGQAEVDPELTRLWTPAPLAEEGLATGKPAFRIRRARHRAGLSLRQGSEMSAEVARTLADKRYFASPGFLSDCEATNVPPRQIHKLLTLSILYCVRFEDLLDWFGFAVDEHRMDTIPATWMREASPSPAKETTAATRDQKSTSGYLASVLEHLGEVPLFLRHSFSFLSGLAAISLRDVFWVGGQRDVLHPLVEGAFFVIVDRRKRRPRIFPRKKAWEQPVYLLRKRKGSYLMASCGMEDGTIVLHPYSDDFVPPERLEKTADVEVVGQIVTVVRSVPSPP
jgi:hypothetical protein